jgi:predicted chitinase
MAIKLTRDDLARLCPRPSKAGEAQKNWDGYVAALTSAEGYALFAEYGINTRAEFCAFIANAAEETGDRGGFTCLWENLSFTSVAAIRRAWGSRASRYSDSWIQKNLIRNPIALGDWAYGGRMGNGVNNGDGFKYRGFSILQTTGKTAHIQYLKGDYSYLSGLRAALMEWKDKNCDASIADGDFDAACIKINGGRNGLADRQRYYAQAKSIWHDDPDWSVENPVVAEDDSTDSVTVGPSLIPQIVTAQDLKGQSRKVDFLDWVKGWGLKLGIGGAGVSTYSLADANAQVGQAKTLIQTLKAEPALLLSVGGIVFGISLFVGAKYLIELIVHDHNEGRYTPSKAQGA